ALKAAITLGQPIVPVFIWNPADETPWEPGAASRWWLHHSLNHLAEDLGKFGSRLILRMGPAETELAKLIRETGASHVFWNRRYEPATRELDTRIEKSLAKAGAVVETHNSSLLFEPWELTTKQGRPFQVYTPFWKACIALDPPARPLARPSKIPSAASWPDSVPLTQLGLLPKIKWDQTMNKVWTPGEKGASTSFQRFLGEAINQYDGLRDRPDIQGTSTMSPHLRFGEISPRMIWDGVVRSVGKQPREGQFPRGAEVYLKELVWREFGYHLLYHFPGTTDQPLRENFARFPWRSNEDFFRAWRKGMTGYPLVDAGMRQLWQTGWMHNRVRMVTASFLVKHLMIPWQTGSRWFWNTLVDADLASNTLGWQWTAGCGADAAPFFRIFNPVS
ncbi:MAG: cryptochrome/photolyase family protein, partial [Gemmataceae bacterium]